MPTAAILACLLSLASALVSVEVYDRENALVARAEVALPGGAAQRGDYVMHNLPKGAGGLSWKFTKMVMRGVDVPVVTELAGLRSQLPSTAWTLTHVAADGAARSDDAGLLDVTVEDGDTLRWRLWAMGDLVKARKARATPTPAPAAPAVPPTDAGDDEEDDADALARERKSQRAKDVGGEYVVTIEEQEGGAETAADTEGEGGGDGDGGAEL
jgi:hypothetical protein